jgi:hypothetical protein
MRIVDKCGNFLVLPEGFRWMTGEETEVYQRGGLLDLMVINVRCGGTDDDPLTDLAVFDGPQEEW